MQFRRSLLYFPLLLLTFSLVHSCTVMRPKATKSGKKLYESFFVSIHTNQYFVKPLEFESGHDLSSLMDITFRDKKEFSDSATVNFSLYFKEVIRVIDGFTITSGSDTVELTDIQHIYSSKSNKQYHSRFTSRAYTPEISRLFRENGWSLGVTFNGATHSFHPSSRTAKNISLLEENLFIIVRE